MTTDERKVELVESIIDKSYSVIRVLEGIGQYQQNSNESELDQVVQNAVKESYASVSAVMKILEEMDETLSTGAGRPPKTPTLILEVDVSRITVRDDSDEVVRVIQSWYDYEATQLWIKESHPGASVMASSSMDFPHEYTDDPDIIKLAKKIQGRK